MNKSAGSGLGARGLGQKSEGNALGVREERELRIARAEIPRADFFSDPSPEPRARRPLGAMEPTRVGIK
jgi:hypothetical protein